MTDYPRAADGFYYAEGRRLCEDCWQPIPRYVDFPTGLVALDSDGDPGGNFPKRRPMNIEGLAATEALQKAVCLPCYRVGFQRVYPGAALPDLRDAVLAAPYVPPPDPPTIYVPEPKA